MAKNATNATIETIAGRSITDISPLPSDPNIRRIRVDGRIVAHLRATDIDALDLTPGRPWSEQTRARVQWYIDLNRARKAALNILGRRARSRGELIERLAHRGFAPDIAKATADELEQDGWLDDANYARDIAASLQRRAPASRKLLVQKLTERMIRPGLAEQIADETIGRANPFDEALAFAQSRYRSLRSLSPRTAAGRIAGALNRRGFEADVVEAVIAKMRILNED